jgi:hypothetical protein
MSSRGPARGRREETTGDEHGSALVMAIFVLVLLTGMGTALLFMTRTEIDASQASVRTKKAFYFAEAGIEDGRTALWHLNHAESFDDELVDAAGSDGTMDFDPLAIVPVYDANENVIAFTGFNDDVPLVARTASAEGWYAAFLTNDPIDIANGLPLTDTNERVMITAIGVGQDRSVEVVQAIVELTEFLPTVPPATITMLGPTPEFYSATSKVKLYSGEDCLGPPNGTPGLYVPVVGAIGTGVLDAELGIDVNPDYESEPSLLTPEDTFADLTDPSEPTVISSTYGPIDPTWTDCNYLHDMMDGIEVVADVVCPDGTRLGSTCIVPASAPERIIFADGDFDVPSGGQEGVLAVTGALTMSGNAKWAGLILVIGEGVYRLNGAGNGTISGGTIVADIAGPDNVYGTADDCTGPDNGFDSAVFDERGGGNSGSIYCLHDIMDVNPARPYDVVEFLQH